MQSLKILIFMVVCCQCISADSYRCWSQMFRDFANLYGADWKPQFKDYKTVCVDQTIFRTEACYYEINEYFEKKGIVGDTMRRMWGVAPEAFLKIFETFNPENMTFCSSDIIYKQFNRNLDRYIDEGNLYHCGNKMPDFSSELETLLGPKLDEEQITKVSASHNARKQEVLTWEDSNFCKRFWLKQLCKEEVELQVHLKFNQLEDRSSSIKDFQNSKEMSANEETCRDKYFLLTPIREKEKEKERQDLLLIKNELTEAVKSELREEITKEVRQEVEQEMKENKLKEVAQDKGANQGSTATSEKDEKDDKQVSTTITTKSDSSRNFCVLSLMCGLVSAVVFQF